MSLSINKKETAEKMLNELAKEAYKTKVEKGFEPSDWSDPKSVASKLALIHSEISESLEEVRENNKYKFYEELIDVLIRTLELLHETGADIDLVYALKTKKNRERPHLHGKKVAL